MPYQIWAQYVRPVSYHLGPYCLTNTGLLCNTSVRNSCQLRCNQILVLVEYDCFASFAGLPAASANCRSCFAAAGCWQSALNLVTPVVAFESSLSRSLVLVIIIIVIDSIHSTPQA